MNQSEKPNILMIDWALKYAARNWAIFPLAPNGKVPYKGSQGFREATTDPEKITAWWTEKPTSNIGLKTGRESGIIILDIDARHNGYDNLEELQRRYGKLPSTLLSRTPRGGIHRYYQHPKDQEYGNAVQLDGLGGIDVRGQNGYVVAPPSTLFGGKASYKFVKPDFPIAKAPTWLLELIAKQAPTQTILQEERKYSVKGEKWLQEALQRATRGNRNHILFNTLLQCRDDGMAESEAKYIALSYAGQVTQADDPFTTREALATLRSVYSRRPRPPARRK